MGWTFKFCFLCFVFVFYEHTDFGLRGSLKCFMVDLECQYLEKGRFCTILLKPLIVCDYKAKEL